MAVVKLVSEKYMYKGDVKKLANYMTNPMRCTNLINGGNNIISETFSYDPDSVAEQFLAIQYGQRFVRRVYHLIINFDPVLDKVDVNYAYKIGERIAGMYSNYQSMFVIHEDKIVPHIHMMINNCPIFPEYPKLTSMFNLSRVTELVDNMIDRRLGII